MSLSQEQIVKNVKKYFKTTEELGVMTPELTEYLGESFIKAPASMLSSQYNAFEGGLITHLLNVTKYAVNINESLPENERVDKQSLVKVCLLHQIGKAHMFKPCLSEWHRTNQGKMYEYATNNVSMRTSERSIFILMSFGIKLNEDEYMSIINFDKVDDKMGEMYNTQLGNILKAASKFAINNEIPNIKND